MKAYKAAVPIWPKVPWKSLVLLKGMLPRRQFIMLMAIKKANKGGAKLLDQYDRKLFNLGLEVMGSSAKGRESSRVFRVSWSSWIVLELGLARPETGLDGVARGSGQGAEQGLGFWSRGRVKGLECGSRLSVSRSIKGLEAGPEPGVMIKGRGFGLMVGLGSGPARGLPSGRASGSLPGLKVSQEPQSLDRGWWSRLVSRGRELYFCLNASRSDQPSSTRGWGSTLGPGWGHSRDRLTPGSRGRVSNVRASPEVAGRG
ncbi:hypothetical protein HAX54_044396 [Datura stramonium]|uniref:Uncharacterized protein n=1 Tax=Datura stramonium TaxID=4076 RepID=A0ABS8SPF5_DATST|nr:hypothetical protein [Datura stramonium]